MTLANFAERLRHPVFRNALLMYFVQFSSYIFPIVALPYLSRKLSPEMFGWVAFGQNFTWYFITLTEYGFNLTATREIAVSSNDLPFVSRIYSAVMTAKLLLTLLGLLILLAVVTITPMLRPQAGLFLICFLAVIGNMLFPVWLYQGMQKLQHIVIRDFLAKALSLAALFIFVHGDSDYLLAAAAQSGGIFLSGLIGALTVRSSLGVRFEMPAWADIRKQFQTGWPAFLSLSTSAFSVVTNMFIVGLRAPVAEIGYYNAAQRIIAAMRSLVSPLSAAIYPYASQKAVKSEADVVRFVKRYAWLFAGPFVLAAITLSLTAPWIMPRFLGAKFTDSVPVFQIMIFTPALFVFTQVYSTYYMLPCGYDKQWMRIMLTTVAVNFAVLIPCLFLFRGSITLALTALIPEATGTLLYWLFYRRQAKRVLANA